MMDTRIYYNESLDVRITFMHADNGEVEDFVIVGDSLKISDQMIMVLARAYGMHGPNELPAGWEEIEQ